MITAYTPTFGDSVLHLASIDGLIVTLCVGGSNLFWLPVMGALSGRAGRRPLLVVFTFLMLVTAYPLMLWLVGAPSYATVAVFHLRQLQWCHGGFLTEIVPVEVRTSSFALAYSLATALFGGFTPAINTYLIHATRNRAIPGLWLSFAAMCGLVASLSARPQAGALQAS
jgi:MFS family permease